MESFFFTAGAFSAALEFFVLCDFVLPADIALAVYAAVCFAAG
jgi:hypothetical protein